MFNVPTTVTPPLDLGAASLQQQSQSINTAPLNTGVILKKGQKVSLGKHNLENIFVGLGWSVNQESAVSYDLDTEVFMLNDQEKVVGDDWFVFYNKKISPDASVRHNGDNRTGVGEGDDETIEINLSKVSPTVSKLVFVVTINEALEKGQNFGQVNNAYIRIVNSDTNQELLRFNLTEYYSNVVSMVVGELYKKDNEWKFNPIGNGTGDDLAGLCVRYGVNLA